MTFPIYGIILRSFNVANVLQYRKLEKIADKPRVSSHKKLKRSRDIQGTVLSPESPTNIMTELNDNLFQAIIALNNTGVSLIRHGYYHEAIDTLKDSMHLMKGLVQIRNSSEIEGTSSIVESTCRPNSNLIDYEAALQAASIRTSLIHHLTQEYVARSTGINVIVVSEQDHPSVVVGQLAQPQPQGTASLCCVTIDLLPVDDEDDGYDTRLAHESALILYNLSIAYRCCDKLPGATSSSQISYQLMEYANAAVSSILSDLPTSGDVTMNGIPLNLFLITLLILHNMNEISYEFEAFRDHYVQHYAAPYEYLVTVMVERFHSTRGKETLTVLARAA